jgi:hypothetical protein
VEERASSPVYSVPHSALPRAFPEKSSGPVLCPHLQLRGSAGIAPASLSSSSKEDARTSLKSLTNVIPPSLLGQTQFSLQRKPGQESLKNGYSPEDSGYGSLTIPGLP